MAGLVQPAPQPPFCSSLFSGATSHELKAGKALFLAGEPGDRCYRLEQGLLKVVVASPRGEERILSMLGPRAIVGELAIIDGGPRSAFTHASCGQARRQASAWLRTKGFGQAPSQLCRLSRRAASGWPEQWHVRANQRQKIAKQLPASTGTSGRGFLPQDIAEASPRTDGLDVRFT
jgi:hypothetical protein